MYSSRSRRTYLTVSRSRCSSTRNCNEWFSSYNSLNSIFCFSRNSYMIFSLSYLLFSIYVLTISNCLFVS